MVVAPVQIGKWVVGIAVYAMPVIVMPAGTERWMVGVRWVLALSIVACMWHACCCWWSLCLLGWDNGQWMTGVSVVAHTSPNNESSSHSLLLSTQEISVTLFPLYIWGTTLEVLDISAVSRTGEVIGFRNAVVGLRETDELDVAGSCSIAAGAHVLGIALSEMIRGSTLEAMVVALSFKGTKFSYRERVTMNGRSETGDGVWGDGTSR